MCAVRRARCAVRGARCAVRGVPSAVRRALCGKRGALCAGGVPASRSQHPAGRAPGPCPHRTSAPPAPHACAQRRAARPRAAGSLNGWERATRDQVEPGQCHSWKKGATETLPPRGYPAAPEFHLVPPAFRCMSTAVPRGREAALPRGRAYRVAREQARKAGRGGALAGGAGALLPPPANGQLYFGTQHLRPGGGGGSSGVLTGVAPTRNPDPACLLSCAPGRSICGNCLSC